MRRRKRMLFALAPLLAGLAFYNYTFFRERAGRMSGSSTSSTSSTPSTNADTTSPAVAGVAPKAEQPLVAGAEIAGRENPRSYEEGIARLHPRVQAPAIISPASWAARDIFTHPLIAAAPAGTAAAPIAASGGAPVAPGESSSTETGPVPLRVDGWVRTPDDEYAIVNGSLAKKGMRLPTDERVLAVSRAGVIVSTGQGVQTLPLGGEEPEPRVPRTTRSAR